MEKTDSITKLTAALVQFQGETPSIKQDDTVKVQTKAGYAYTFKYASMAAIKETCQPILHKHGLAVSQLVGQRDITTILFHESGEYISTQMDIPVKEGMTCQEIGSVITYMKRYAYSALLNIVSDEDDDGNIGSGNNVTKPAAKQPVQPKETPPRPPSTSLQEGTEQYAAVVQWVKAGGDDDAREKLFASVLKKYIVSAEVKVSIMNAAKAQRENNGN